MTLNISTCSYYQNEIEHVLKDIGNANVSVDFFPPVCTSSKRFDSDYFMKNKSNSQRSEILGSTCCIDSERKNNYDHIHLNVEDVCFNWLMNNKLVEENIDKYFIISPGWLVDWENIVCNKWGFDSNSAKEFFDEMNKTVLLLDTCVYGDVDEYIQSFSNFIDKDVESLTIGTDYLKLKVDKIISDYQNEENEIYHKREIVDKNTSIAEYTMIFDLLSKLDTGMSQDDLMKKLLDIIIMLVAPKVAVLAIFKSGKLLKCVDNSGYNVVPGNLIEFCNSNQKFKMFENNDGFMMKSVEENEYSNCIFVEGFMFPEYIVKYTSIMHNIIGLFTVVLSRARNYSQYLKTLDEVRLKELYYRQLFEGSPEPILTLDNNLLPLTCNPAFTEKFEYTYDEICTTEIRNKFLYNNSDDDSHKILMESLITEKYITLETKRMTKSSRILDVEILIYPIINNGNRLGYYIIYTDITERKLSNDQLRRKNKELKEAITGLKFAQAKLIESEKAAALSTSIAGLAHELNSPIGMSKSIVSFIESKTNVFKKSYQDNKLTKSGLDAFIGSIDESVGVLNRNLDVAKNYIADFKQIAVDQSSEKIRTFELNEYIHSVIGSMRPVLKGKKYILNVNCQDGVIVKSYPGAFSQVLNNLIQNSIIHGFNNSGDGIITIEVELLDANVIVSYSDNGVGINSDDISKIFEPFYTTKQDEGGSGLGLSIVKNLVTEILKGEITCKSDTDRNTCFQIIFPIDINSI